MRSLARHRLAPLVALGILAACSDEARAPMAPAAVAVDAQAAFTGATTGRTVVVFRDTAAIPAAGLTLISTLGGTVTNRFDRIGVAVVSGLSLSALTSLKANVLVQSVGADRVLNWLPGVTAAGVVDAGAAPLDHRDPAAARYFADGTQWNMRIIGADLAWAAGLQGDAGTRVAILDTGIDYTNRELVGHVDLAASRSFSSLVVCDAGPCVDVPTGDPQLPGDAPYMDNHFHGTHVASTIVSNSISVAPIAPHVTVIAVKVLSAVGSGWDPLESTCRHASLSIL